MKVGLYARVSTIDKDQNPEVQLHILREHSKAHGWDIYKEYVDHATGSNCDRPALKEIMEDARRKRIDIVLTLRIDRFMRSTLDMLSCMDQLKHYGVAFLCTEQQIDTSSPNGELLFTILSAIAKWEREIIRERVMEGLALAKAEGKRIGRKSLREAGLISEKVLSEAIAEARGRVRATHRILRRRKVKVSLGWVSMEIARRKRPVQEGAPSK
jgi:DNA invertase Pin-like site-specific DNA recombinase